MPVAEEATTLDQLEQVKRLTKDLVQAAATLSYRQARFIVDGYYMMQINRIAAAQQVRTLTANGEPSDLIAYLGTQYEILENQVRRGLDSWTTDHPVGNWAKSITGIGPVIAAGLLAHIQIRWPYVEWLAIETKEGRVYKDEAEARAAHQLAPFKTPGVGNLWSFAGLNSTQVWEKGQKRPFNMRLKTLAVYKMGESFVKVHNNPKDYYGKLYEKRKRLEEARNEAGEYKALAAEALPHFRKTTEAFKWYSKGMLPPARIHARARRYAVKIFLSHFYLVLHFHETGTMPRVPYVFAHVPGQHEFFVPPNVHLIPGLQEKMPAYLKLVAEVAAMPKDHRKDQDTGLFPME